MIRSRSRTALFGTATVLAAVNLLAACSSSGGGAAVSATYDPKAPVTITVGDEPPTSEAPQRAAFLANVKQFETLNPNITVNATETQWSPQTYQAMLAGGTMPTTLIVPLTEIQSLAERGQVLDLAAYTKNDKVVSAINPTLTKQTTHNGDLYGVPVGAFTMALIYDRALYTAAGLDPDKPPTTWAQVEQNAVTIHQKTGKAGFLIPTVNNFGGFVLTAMSYGNGGALEKTSGSTVTSTIDSAPVQAALQFLHDVRWKDGAFGSNYLLDPDSALKEVVTGSAGQAILAGDRYGEAVFNDQANPDDVGIAPLPQSADGIGTLAGGNISVVSPKASAAQAAAALKWIDFEYLTMYTDKDAAIAAAKASKASGQPVGAPTVPLFDAKTQAQYLEYIKDYIDVPRDHFTAYLNSVDTLPMVLEPTVAAQQIYAMLDSTVQAVLTNQGTDISALLQQNQSQATSLINAAG